MKKQKFTALVRGGEPREVDFYPLVYLVRDTAHKLAMHKDPTKRNWQISDPASGAKVLTITAHYQGAPVASGYLTIAQAREAAQLDLDDLVSRISAERFNATMANPRPF